MKKKSVKKIAVFDQGAPVFFQLMTKAKELFDGQDAEFIRIACDEETVRDHMAVTMGLAEAVREEDPDLLLIGATSLGEEVAPALGIRLKTGVAAHCVDIRENGEGRIAFHVPAFGGKVIGEIFIPNGRPMIATVKPGMFSGTEESAGSFRTVMIGGDPIGKGAIREDAAESAAEDGAGCRGRVRLIETRPKETKASNLDKADVVVCGGFGIGSAEAWQKIETLAERLGGAAGCTRPVVDMGWGPDEDSMIGTSGRTVRPKVYIGFGISGAAHHLCGIRDAGTIISINNDKAAEAFAASDHIGVFDAGRMIDLLLEKTEE